LVGNTEKEEAGRRREDGGVIRSVTPRRGESERRIVAGLLNMIRAVGIELVLKRTPSVAITCARLRLVLMRAPCVTIAKSHLPALQARRVISQPSIKHFESTREGSKPLVMRRGENSARVGTPPQPPTEPLPPSSLDSS
jgi:hypothetical protein